MDWPGVRKDGRSTSATARVTRDELHRGLKGLLEVDVPMSTAAQTDGAVVGGTGNHLLGRKVVATARTAFGAVWRPTTRF